MVPNLKTQGDKVEIDNYQYISENLIGYEEIWKLYVGHDGMGGILAGSGLSQEENEKRKKTAQHNYTILISLIGLRNTMEEYSNHAFKQDLIMKYDGDIVKVLGYVGRIRDNIEKLYYQYKKDAKALVSELNKYYEERNQVLHNTRIGLFIKDGQLWIPKTLVETKPFKNDVDWKQLSENDVIKFHDFVSDALIKLTSQSNRCFFNILPDIRIMIKSKSVKFDGQFTGNCNSLPAISGSSYGPSNLI